MKGGVEEATARVNGAGSGEQAGAPVDVERSTTIDTATTHDDAGSKYASKDESPTLSPGHRSRAIGLQRSRSPELAGLSPSEDRRRQSVRSTRSERSFEGSREASPVKPCIAQVSPCMSRSTTIPSVGEAAGNQRHRPSVHSIYSTHSGRMGPRKSITSMDLAALENVHQTSVQVDAKDLAAPEGHLDTSTAGIGQIVLEERKRLSSKFSSQAYENDMRGLMAEKKLMRQNSETSSGISKRTLKHPVAKQLAPMQAGQGQEDAAEEEMRAINETMMRCVGRVTPLKWLMTVLAAVLIALQAGGIIFGTIKIVEVKVDLTARLAKDGGAGQFYAFLMLWAYAAPACFVGSWLATYIAPHAGGSGIPEIKAFLNGIQMPKAFTKAAWLCRATGLMLVTSAGLFAGTEGPFAHLGGITAKFFADGPFGGAYWPAVLQGHRNRCEFVSQGAAMGVAAAFGAPIGGILFSLEEASSFWSKALTWRAFLGTVIAALLAKLVKVGFTSLVVEGFISFPDKDASFELWELLTFSPLALVSGLLGAVFCNATKALLLWRRRVFRLGAPTRGSRLRRLLEVQLIVLVTLLVCFWPAAIMGCRELDHPVGGAGARRLGGALTDGAPDLSGGLCPQVDGRDTYSDLGYILLSPKEKAIRTLFSKEMADGAYMSVPSLLLGWAVCFFVTILTFGAAIPVGLFIPNILAGACLGRAFGQALLEMDFDVHPGVYALMGAAGALGGFSRMTISLAVIFLEITNNMNLLMPLMLVIMISKNVADQFGPSVYDTVLETNPEIHLLEDNLSEDHLIILQGVSVRHVARREIVVVHTQESIDEIVLLLQRCKFGGFPVVDDQGVLVGLVTRTQLVSVLDESREGGEVVDLMACANTAPEITPVNTSVIHAFQHFRACGLQHLCVVDEMHRLVGILTRTDMAKLCHHGLDIEEVRALIGKSEEADESSAEGAGAAEIFSESSHSSHHKEECEAEPMNSYEGQAIREL